ncbi:bifunctional UDP-sugar hydrolase/5'-nucleotidase UshA [Vibrio breoganii]|uniref:bifunctional UDP-sugar hydrolase/5'-nucleotidase UshA n=1 Tax=Vibrio breoganii TaxID=553239 RepID=UPI0002D47C87|nr:bifunctional UDP-sugar hydrolase/5'-nucleotidase UshA [Vibrio breoganii]OED85120.1 bifunctional UDP-sugar hydrolase/5'-nucleotidase [Vibrio breoganii ZF-55]PMG91456.1 bifunctional UDP-sugar hydrolase/5'-nucleotidase [Vibrio breoganii]PMI20535.1 bifunctional UDP-sugar hydrolase/5'-nucleotidase [Vibrio breoganii]PML54757.1 bifunctional UDP-sugar hydrolase/5'-nucleotidase [Vibrio breoganii]PML82732.1 bifunctional UDP-sugar hydrolase/5'-nucleotidase [Vibrio breoganii]
MKSLVLAVAFGTLAVGCASDNVVETNGVQKLTILHTNDHHGRFWPNKYGELGMAARKTLIDQIREEVESEGGAVLLLSGGDINTGVPESDLLDAEPDFKGMTLLGYDAMALGNHEFDNPLSVLEKQQEWAEFPMLSANIYDKESQTRKFQPYQMFEKEGLKIAVIGLTTEDTAKIGNPEFIQSLDFRDPKPEAKQLLAEIEQSEQPDITIAVTHMGHYQDGNNGGNAPGDVALARYLPAGALDMVIGGHSQEPVCMEGPNLVKKQFKPGDECQPDQQNGTWIMQAFEWGKYVGRADYEYENGELNLVHYELVPINLTKKVEVDGKKERVIVGEEIEQDSDVEDFLAPYQEQGQEKLNVKIAESNGKLEGDRNKVRFEQTNLGRLIATAHMTRAKADFGVMNSGGVRDSIAQGNITYKDVLTVQPFGNIVTYVDMTGVEVLDYLNVVALKPTDSGAYAQFAGISMTVMSKGVTDVMIGGKAIDPNGKYRFSIPSFNAAGGDGYPAITAHPGYVDTGFVDAEVLKEYLESHSPLDVTLYAPNGEVRYP